LAASRVVNEHINSAMLSFYKILLVNNLGLLLRPLSVIAKLSLRYRPKYMAHHIFQSETELQNIPGAAPSLPSFSVSEKLARYGSSALSGAEHLTLLFGKESVAFALIRHFGSLKALARASFQELRQFLPRRKAEAVLAALSMSSIAKAEYALANQLGDPESIYTGFYFDGVPRA
jgi:hypothetical protein